MAKKFKLTSGPVTVAATLTKDNLYLDSDKADPIITDLRSQLKIINTSLTTMSKTIKKAAKDKTVLNAYSTLMTKWANTIDTVAPTSVKKATALKSKYDADTKEYVLKLLSDRIDELERKIAALGEINL